MLSDHPSKGLCHGCSSAIVVLDNITSQGRLENTSVWMNDFVGGALAARRLAMTYKAVEHIARTRPKDSPRNTKVVVVMETWSTDTPAPQPWGLPEVARAWLACHPADQQPTFDDAVEIARKLLDEGDLGPDARAPVDYRAFFAPLEDGSNDALRTGWLPRAKHCSHYWESMRLTAARYQRDREPMPDALAQWLAEVLDGTLTPPRRRSGPKGFHLRNVWIIGVVNTLMALGLHPTRNVTRGDKPCAAGGSACDAVGVALAEQHLAMPYKAVEQIARTRPKHSPRNK